MQSQKTLETSGNIATTSATISKSDILAFFDVIDIHFKKKHKLEKEIKQYGEEETEDLIKQYEDNIDDLINKLQQYGSNLEIDLLERIHNAMQEFSRILSRFDCFDESLINSLKVLASVFIRNYYLSDEKINKYLSSFKFAVNKIIELIQGQDDVPRGLVQLAQRYGDSLYINLAKITPLYGHAIAGTPKECSNKQMSTPVNAQILREQLLFEDQKQREAFEEQQKQRQRAYGPVGTSQNFYQPNANRSTQTHTTAQARKPRTNLFKN